MDPMGNQQFGGYFDQNMVSCSSSGTLTVDPMHSKIAPFMYNIVWQKTTWPCGAILL